MNLIRKIRIIHDVTNAQIFWNSIIILLLYIIPLFWGMEAFKNVFFIYSFTALFLIFGIWLDGNKDYFYKYFCLFANLGGAIVLINYGIFIGIETLIIIIAKPITKFNKWLNNDAAKSR